MKKIIYFFIIIFCIGVIIGVIVEWVKTKQNNTGKIGINTIENVCPECGFVSAFAKYCYHDGTKLEQRKRVRPRCPKCKKEYSRMDTYCEKCGFKIEREKRRSRDTVLSPTL